MAWSKVGEIGTIITAGSGNQSITLPGPPIANDLVIVATSADVSCANCIATSGYTVPENGTDANPGANFGYKVMESTPDTTVLIVRDATILRSNVVQVWRGGNAASILDQSMPTPATGSSANPDPPAIVTQNANALVVAIAHLDDDDTTVTAYPSGYSNGISQNTGQGSTTVGSTTAVCSYVKVTAGSEDPGAYTMGSSDQWQAATISFRILAEAVTYLDAILETYQPPTPPKPVVLTPVWPFTPQYNKPYYNEGDHIASWQNPVWSCKYTEDESKVPITPTHQPCGYWTKDYVKEIISRIDASFDIKHIDPGECVTVGYRLLIYQNDSYYQAGYVTTTYNWVNHVFSNLQAADFYLVSGIGAPHPDFSASRPPIQFGYVGTNSTPGYQTTTKSGIDNWSVTINLKDNFFDDLFSNDDWSAKIIYQLGTPPPSFNAYQVLTGGNPNEYRYLAHVLGGPEGGSIITAHLQRRAVFDC